MIDINAIERYVDQVLEVNGFCKGDKELLRQLLHRLYTAASIFHLMTEEQRALVGRIQVELSAFFVTKCNLKEGKRRGRKRKISPYNPFIKEKQGQEKGLKNTHTAARRDEFHQECLEFVDKFENQRLADFFNYWSEEDTKTGKMRFEKQRFWNTERRLKRWMNTSYTSDDTAAALRLEKAKKGKTKETVSTKQQQALAEQRERDNAVREAQLQEAKANAVSLEEYARLNPESTLAKMFAKNET